MQQREPWRHEAEVACLKSGEVKISSAVAQLPSISGPGMCGADFPLKVASLGDGAPMAFADDLRPPATVPGFSPRPASSPYGYPQPAGAGRYPSSYPAPARAAPVGAAAEPGAPLSLEPPGLATEEEEETYPPEPTYGRPSPQVSREALPPPATPPRPYSMREGPYDPPRAQPPEPYYTPPRRGYEPRPYETSRAQDSRGYEPLPPGQFGHQDESEPLPPLGPATPVAGGSAAIVPAATLACPMVSALDQWVTGSVQPAAQRWFGQPVVEIKQISAYSCRGMNGNPRARISEHAFGNALDIAAFTLADGRRITVKNGWRGQPEERGFLHDVHASACEQFSTVLGPGSNIYHYDHLHVDLMRRSSGRSICNPAAIPGDLVAGRRGGPVYTGSTGKTTPSLGFADPEAPRGRGQPTAVAGED